MRLPIFRFACLVALCCASGLRLTAQQATAETGGMRIHFGNSAAELTGPWRFHVGDDPAWSKAGYDDATWEMVDLTPPPDTSDPDLGTSGFIPGWTEHGHAGYTGYAWYRLRVVAESQSGPLALKMPGIFDDAYQVFVNGRQMGEFGSFGARSVTAYSALPRSFRLPPSPDGVYNLAIRMWMDRSTPILSPDAGGLHAPPVLGHAPAIATQVRLDWNDIAHDVGSGFLEALVLLLALAVTLTHFWMDHRDKAYLWLALVTFVTLLGNMIVLLVNFTTALPQSTEVLLTDVLIAPLRIGLWVLFWAYWFQRAGPPAWLQRAVWSVIVLLAGINLLLRPPLFGVQVPVRASDLLLPVALAGKLVLAGLLFRVVYQGIREHEAEGWLALPAVLLAAMANYQHELSLIHVPTTMTLFGFAISLGTGSTMLSLLLITMMLSRRFLWGQRQKVEWKLEMQQAREVQQLLIPNGRSKVNGFSIESEYRPAREVGGDFFQILPSRVDGSVLLIVGDVTGKGLCAGMMVALILGVLRTAAQTDSDPEFVLRILNEQLCERSHTSATCLAMRLTAEGQVSLANAGHLPPYVGGRELALEGALPLGILEGIEYPATRFTLAPGEALYLMSDGVVEAQGAHGELFGFDRIDSFLKTAIPAASLAAAAQAFGQEDDILVLRVERDEVRTAAEPARAAVTA